MFFLSCYSMSIFWTSFSLVIEGSWTNKFSFFCESVHNIIDIIKINHGGSSFSNLCVCLVWCPCIIKILIFKKHIKNFPFFKSFSIAKNIQTSYLNTFFSNCFLCFLSFSSNYDVWCGWVVDDRSTLCCRLLQLDYTSWYFDKRARSSKFSCFSCSTSRCKFMFSFSK